MAQRVGDRMRAVTQVQPAGDVVQNVLDGALRVRELGRDLGGVEPVGDQAQYLYLALRQAREGHPVRPQHLPLQPADRIGAAIGYRQADWRAGLTWAHARGQDRLAAFETTATPGYDLIDANVSYTQKLESTDLTWFLLAKNLLNRDVRLSTSLLKDIAPLPGRNLVFGVRAKF